MSNWPIKAIAFAAASFVWLQIGELKPSNIAAVKQLVLTDTCLSIDASVPTSAVQVGWDLYGRPSTQDTVRGTWTAPGSYCHDCYMSIWWLHSQGC